MLGAWGHYSQITGRVLVCIAASIALLCGPAYLLDSKFGTWPIITGVALIISLPLSQYLVIKSMQDYLKHNSIN